MEKKTYITPDIQALLSQESTFESTEPVDAGKIRRFAKSLGFEDPRYYDWEGGKPVAPATFIFSVNHDSGVEIDESGRPKSRLSLPPPFGPAMRGGNRYQFFQSIGVGDQIRIEKKVTDLKEKEGKSGTLLFLTYQLKYTNHKGELLGINTETLVFRVEKAEKGGA